MSVSVSYDFPPAPSYLVTVVTLHSLPHQQLSTIPFFTLSETECWWWTGGVSSLDMKSSLSYQLLLYLGSYYCLGFISIEVLLLVYKSIILPYQSLTLTSEVIIVT